MRLLICTQKVDQEDPVLGFFHQWINVFAEHCEQVHVICLYEGVHALPANVFVHSLGKEKSQSRIKYVFEFVRCIVQIRNEYDAVFVHMNPEYVVLGGLLWRMWNKRVALWYNHKMGGIRARVAALLVHVVFYVSPDAFMARFKKARQMGAGIDMSQFGKENVKRIPRSILSLGRISPVKRLEVIADALLLLQQKGIPFKANVYGSPANPEDVAYEKMLHDRARYLIEKGVVNFYPGVPNYKTPALYATHDIFVNMTPSGSFDKTVIEALASGTLTATCNRSFERLQPDHFLVRENDRNHLAEKLESMLLLDEAHKIQLRKEVHTAVLEKHNLSNVIRNVLDTIHQTHDKAF